MPIQTKNYGALQGVADNIFSQQPTLLPTRAEVPSLTVPERVAGVGEFLGMKPLGETISRGVFQLTSEYKQLEEMVGRGEITQEELDAAKGTKYTPLQVLGSAAQTILMGLPITKITPAFKALKGMPFLRSVVQSTVIGGGFGTAYGTASGITEGKRLEQVVERAITGGLFGTALGFGGGLAMKGIGAAGKLAAPHLPEWAQWVVPVKSRFAAMGKQGEDIAMGLEKIGVGTGKRLGVIYKDLADVGLIGVPRYKAPVPLLERAERIKLGRVLEGEIALGKLSQQGKAAYGVIKPLMEKAAQEGLETRLLKGVVLNYFPHSIPSVEVIALSKKEQTALTFAKTAEQRESIILQLGKKESIRRDVLQNVVERGVFKNTDEAWNVLNGWSEFVGTGQRLGNKINEFISSNKMKPYLNWLVKSGKAKSLATAQNQALEDFFGGKFSKVVPKSRFFEYSRKMDFPFYDPDPARVIPAYFGDIAPRLEEVKFFGQAGLDGALLELKKAEGLDVWKKADHLLRMVMGTLDRTGLMSQKVSLVMRALNTPKLTFAQTVNIGQSMNTLMATDVGSVWWGIQQAFRQEGIVNALRSGATLQSVLKQQMAYTGGGTKFADAILKYSGFTWTEMFNRTVAANAFMRYAEKTASRLAKNPTDKFLKWRLEEMGLSVKEVLAGKGLLTQDQLLTTANRGSAMTQFLSDPLHLPAFASSPEGKVLFQFKNFAYNQAIFVTKQLTNPNVPFSKKMRVLGILGLVYPMTGEVLGDVRSLITGAKRPTKAWNRYLSNLANAGAFGIWLDFFQSVQYNRLLEFGVGPTGAMIQDVVVSHWQSLKQGEIDPAAKFWLQQTGIGRIPKNLLYPSKAKNMGNFLEFWEKL